MTGGLRLSAVLFDFGGVFTESPFEAAKAFAAVVGVEPQLVVETVFGSYDQDSDHPWHRLERGEMSLADAREEILALGSAHGFEADLFRVLAALSRSSGPRAAFVERARSLRRSGIPAAIVTNNVREFRDAWRAMIPVDELFDLVVDSCEVGIRKPDARIFRHALDALGGIAPGEALFLDDHEGNVRAARDLGLMAIRVDPDPAAALAEFDRLLGGAGARREPIG